MLCFRLSGSQRTYAEHLDREETHIQQDEDGIHEHMFTNLQVKSIFKMDVLRHGNSQRDVLAVGAGGNHLRTAVDGEPTS